MAKLGAYFEKAIKETNEHYENTDRAFIQFVPTPMVMYAPGRYTHAAKSTVDFMGFMPDGRCIGFDTKENRESTLNFHKLRIHQVIFLNRLTSCGGIGFFLLRLLHEKVKGVWVVPVTDEFVARVYESGDYKSINREVLDNYGYMVQGYD